MFDPTKTCTEECELYYLNLTGILTESKTEVDVDLIISQLRLQPKLQARVHELRMQRIDPFVALDCEHKLKN